MKKIIAHLVKGLFLLLIGSIWAEKVSSQTIPTVRTDFSKKTGKYETVTWHSVLGKNLKESVLDETFPGFGKTSKENYLETTAYMLNQENFAEKTGLKNEISSKNILYFWENAKREWLTVPAGFNSIPEKQTGILAIWKDEPYTGWVWTFTAPNGVKAVLAKDSCGNAKTALIMPPPKKEVVTSKKSDFAPITTTIVKEIVVEKPVIQIPAGFYNTPTWEEPQSRGGIMIFGGGVNNQPNPKPPIQGGPGHGTDAGNGNTGGNGGNGSDSGNTGGNGGHGNG